MRVIRCPQRSGGARRKSIGVQFPRLGRLDRSRSRPPLSFGTHYALLADDDPATELLASRDARENVNWHAGTGRPPAASPDNCRSLVDGHAIKEWLTAAKRHILHTKKIFSCSRCGKTEQGIAAIPPALRLEWGAIRATYFDLHLGLRIDPPRQTSHVNSSPWASSIA